MTSPNDPEHRPKPQFDPRPNIRSDRRVGRRSLPEDADGSDDGEVILLSHVALARNVDGLRFLPSLSSRERSPIIEDLSAQIVSALPGFGRVPAEEGVDRRLVGWFGCSSTDAHPAIELLDPTEEGRVSIVLGCRDHIRIVSERVGAALGPAAGRAIAVDRSLEERFCYAAALDLGYLTAAVHEIGSGTTVAFLAHVPGLLVSGTWRRVRDLAERHKIELFGFRRPGGGYVGQVVGARIRSSPTTSEGAQVRTLARFARGLVHYELLGRQEALHGGSTRLRALVDEAVKTVAASDAISTGQALALMSLIRFGAWAGFVSVPTDRLAATMLAVGSGDDYDGAEAERQRAARLRMILQQAA